MGVIKGGFEIDKTAVNSLEQNDGWLLDAVGTEIAPYAKLIKMAFLKPKIKYKIWTIESISCLIGGEKMLLTGGACLYAFI